MSEKSEVRDQADPLKYAMELLKVEDSTVDHLNPEDGSPQNQESEQSEVPVDTELVGHGDDRRLDTTPLPAGELQVLEKRFELISHRGQGFASELLQTDIKMSTGEIVSVDFYSLGKQLHHPETFASLYQLHSGCFPEQLILEVDASLSAAIVDRMLGGDSNLDCASKHPMTAIESKLMLRFVSDFASEIQTVIDADWVGVPTIVPLEEATQWDGRNDVEASFVLVPINVQFGKHRGQLSFFFPHCAIQRFGTSPSYHRLDSSDQLHGPQRVITSGVEQAKLRLSVTLATAKVKTSDLLGLEVGDIITTEKNPSEAMDLIVQGIPKFKVTPGSHQGKKAVQVERWIEKPDERS